MRRLIDAFEDPRIGRAIALMHQDPAKSWTVDSLARAVGMSRASFAMLFREMIGASPVSYLTDWRLQCAVAALKISLTQA